MNPMKVFGAVGEAGIVLADSQTEADRLRNLRYHGLRDKEVCEDVSLNARLDTIQAAILSIRLRSIEDKLRRREAIAQRYAAQLSNTVGVPRPSPHVRSAWYHYTILCDRRDELAEALRLANIECKIYHPKLMPAHPAHWRDLSQFPVGESIVSRILCLPMHDMLTDRDVDRVAQAVCTFYGRAA
jgi:dTDP-4-amino-4,6-dideoxygalactose transaminase